MQDRGAMFCACNLALSVYSGMVAKKMGLDPEAVRKEWVSGVLPEFKSYQQGSGHWNVPNDTIAHTFSQGNCFALKIQQGM